MDLDASFIVPTYRRADILTVSVPLLLSQAYPADRFEVLVASDGPDPETTKVMAGITAPNLTFLDLPENRGPGSARNAAIARARGRVLVFVDDDSLVRSDFLARHLRHHADRDDVVVSGPIIDVATPPDMANPPPVSRFAYHTNPFPTGNASILRQRVLDAGGFDENFRHYGWEDPELYARLSSQGLRRRFDRNAPIYHLRPKGGDRTFAYEIRRERERGRNGALYYAKHPRFAVGLQTKQLGLFHGLDKALDAAFGLEAKRAAAEAGTWAPGSALMRSLVLLHTEISAGRDGTG